MKLCLKYYWFVFFSRHGVEIHGNYTLIAKTLNIKTQKHHKKFKITIFLEQSSGSESLGYRPSENSANV